MSNEVDLEYQNIDQSHEKHVPNQRTSEQNQKGLKKKKEMIQKLKIEGLDDENNIAQDSQRATQLGRCSKHPEEDLQFYCFNKDHLLCSECLVSGQYVGLEISNIKKAASKLKGKLNDFITEASEKCDAFPSIEEEIGNHEEELEKTLIAYEEEISKLFGNVRDKLNLREQELLENCAKVREARALEFKSAIGFLQNYKEEIEQIKESIENELKNLGELELCQYSIENTALVTNLVNNSSLLTTGGIKEKIENQQLQDQGNLSKLQDESKLISKQIDSLGGLDINQFKLNMNKETLRGANNANHGTLKLPLFLSQTPSRSKISLKSTYLSEDPINSGNLPKSPEKDLFGKHLAKVQEIRKQTPKQETRIESNILTKTDLKRTEAKNSLVLEMKRNSMTKKFSALSLTDNSSLLDNYKEILNKKTESKTPKTFMFSINLTPSTKSLGSDIYSPGTLKPASLMTSITSKNADKPEKICFDSSMKRLKLDKNFYGFENTDLDRRSSAKFTMRENDGSKGLNVDKMFMKRKTQERTETASFVDRGMKKKLDNLSSSLFK